ncbi:MAG TPA: HAMP domain-containing sensor histidine kinase [Candidatus Limnocylindria bacterium]|nr:HAMP domain-containing sensor histidine kinase [Candidatus Limnocylindria bacterium]
MNIRTRLALWYGALLALVLGATLAVAFVVHTGSHESDVDSSLRTSWEHAASELIALGSTNPSHPVTLTTPAQAASSPTAIWLILPGEPSSPGVGDTGDPLLARFQPASATDGLHDTGLPGGRVRSFAGNVSGVPGARLVIAASMSAFDASVGSLGLILGLMGVAGIAFAVTGGWAISASALRPIAKMTETARAIALSRGFARRIEVRTGGRDELSELGRTFNHMLASLDDAYRRQQRFVADVSHELRTPLTALQGGLELLGRGKLPADEAQATLAEARQETRRLARLVDDLLVLARADAGPQPFIAKPVPLDEVVMEVFRELRGQAGPRLHVVDLDAAVVQGERDRLKQLVLILADNALSYTPAPGEVRLSLRRKARETVLVVEDEGIGVSAETAARAFERFYRGEEAQRLDPAGTGLGLSIAKWIVERHGGTIALGQRQPRGTSVTVRLPANASMASVTTAA